MQLTREPISAITVRKVEHGVLQIGDQRYRSTVAIAGGSVLSDWECPPLGSITMDALTAILVHEPEVLVIGGGFQPQRPPRELTFGLARRGIGMEFMDTPAACRTFNILLAEDRKPAAIFYVD